MLVMALAICVCRVISDPGVDVQQIAAQDILGGRAWGADHRQVHREVAGS